MKLQDAIHAGFRHLIENRLRAVLSILGIFIGIASVLCMVAIGDGAKFLIEKDLEKLGGPNPVHFRTRHSIWKRGRFVRLTTERYTRSDVQAIEAECPDILFVLPKNDRHQALITSRPGGQSRTYIEVVTADYAAPSTPASNKSVKEDTRTTPRENARDCTRCHKTLFLGLWKARLHTFSSQLVLI